MVNDLYRFCVNGSSVLRVDTTFELVEGLWLTDTTYTNEALIDLKGKNPEFPGPSFWQFRKTRETVLSKICRRDYHEEARATQN